MGLAVVVTAGLKIAQGTWHKAESRALVSPGKCEGLLLRSTGDTYPEGKQHTTTGVRDGAFHHFQNKRDHADYVYFLKKNFMKWTHTLAFFDS